LSKRSESKRLRYDPESQRAQARQSFDGLRMPFDRPLDRLGVVSVVERLKALSTAEGVSLVEP
jgi:hypothetical protein